jgi:hypothetical protein
LGDRVTSSLAAVDLLEMLARAPPMATETTPLRFFPLIVRTDWGAPVAGEKLVRSGAPPPVQNRGSVGGARNVATTEPPDSVSDLRQGAFIECLQ